MFYSKPFLEQRIKEERFRVYRTGSPFSIVLFSPYRFVSAEYRNRKRAIDSIISFLDQETRETDIKGWWDKKTIAIILLDTLPEDALLLIDKLVHRIKANGYGNVEPIREAPFKVIAFPNRHVSGGEDNQDNERQEDSKNHSNHNDRNTNPLTKISDCDPPAGNGLKKHQEFIKRSFDILVSLTGLIILSPLLLLCTLLIKLDSRGPVFFKQTRVGRDGKFFTFLKFRSMYHNVDQEVHKNHVKNLMNHKAGLSPNGGPDEKTYKLAEDKRVTRIGKFLRRASIDELPQLINVLKGDMTLVGPRPHPVYEAEQYDLWHKHRLDTKPGITGLGQIRGRFNTKYEDVYRLDIQYLKRWSLFLDLKILFKTIPIVLSRRGAV
ncbi:MAG: sugar transferase [Candidatus Hodarchaeota archaeon]